MLSVNTTCVPVISGGDGSFWPARKYRSRTTSTGTFRRRLLPQPRRLKSLPHNCGRAATRKLRVAVSDSSCPVGARSRLTEDFYGIKEKEKRRSRSHRALSGSCQTGNPPKKHQDS